MLICIPAETKEATIQQLEAAGETAFCIGRITPRGDGEQVTYSRS
ncbi:MAG: hypothetical protein DRQ56_02965 [Gammaproteobacteria bacterium]|nr:MAG: hypothetical protein DRQ56_02965 [Gammaproteobacteria bacterium]